MCEKGFPNGLDKVRLICLVYFASAPFVPHAGTSSLLTYQCGASLNYVVQTEATIVMVINIFWPGVGTLISACMGDCQGSTIAVGILQVILFPLLIGWIWAVCWGVKLRQYVVEVENAAVAEGADPTMKGGPSDV